MQIIKSTAIIAAMIIAAMGIESQTVQATSDDEFKIRVTLKGVDSLTGELDVTVRAGDGTTTTQIVDPFREGNAGTVTIDDFELSEDSTDIGELYRVCVSAIDYNNESECVQGHRGDGKVNRVYIEVPSGIGRAGDTTYYDENGNVVEDDGEFVPSTYQGDDSNAVDNNQGTGVSVSIGDDSYNNNITVDQRTTFGDVLKELIPVAKKVGSAAKNTAVEILN
jgi:hypothetical protein